MWVGYADALFVGGQYRFGSFEVSGRVSPITGKFGLGFSSMW